MPSTQLHGFDPCIRRLFLNLPARISTFKQDDITAHELSACFLGGAFAIGVPISPQEPSYTSR